MLNNKKIVVILPAYNASRTLKKTYLDLDLSFIDEVILVDDCSTDETIKTAQELNIRVYQHEINKGYGANQKTCYNFALKSGADIVVMIHPDYQYDPRLALSLAGMIAYDVYDLALGSRILGKKALIGGMPLYKYISNRVLTFVQNILINQKLSEYHTGLRAFNRNVLETIPFNHNSDDFIFDNEFIVQAHYFKFRIGEISCPTRYFPDASSIDFFRSCKYGFGCLGSSFKYIVQRLGIKRFTLFDKGKE
ncbi:MAG: glycosyltransferase family 2 protein [bacterium]